jgi:hypothetical protein
MHYPFEPGMILEPEEYYKTGLNPDPGMSEEDRVWIRSFYPPLSPSESLPLLKYRCATAGWKLFRSRFDVVQCLCLSAHAGAQWNAAAALVYMKHGMIAGLYI